MQVAVRVRPLLPKEKLINETVCVKIHPGASQLVIGKDKAFTFDYCISPKVTQEQLYERCIDPLVTSCFEGYNATVFAYGQTGSGKTYTIGGGNLLTQTEEELGIIPRAVKQIFTTIQNNPSRAYGVKLSYFEIYKEELKDLLDTESSSKDLHIREDSKSNTVVMGASELECESLDDVMLYLERGSACRRTGSTQMNEHSSRSHSVFTLVIEQRWSDSDSVDCNLGQRSQNPVTDVSMDETGDLEHYVCSKFHFVDLAGSERAHRTGNAGDRLKESIHINSGLLALGNVISCLGDNKRKVTHIPYRDSKITRILKDSLGGNAKTLMICCISPASSSLDESLNALKYANRARNIKNKPVINKDPRSMRFEEMQSEIKALRDELQRQKTYGMISDDGVQRDVAAGDSEHLQQLENKVSRLELECSHYRMIADEAYKQLSEIKDRDMMSRSQVLRLGDWLELMEEIKNKVPVTLRQDISDNQLVLHLERELEQCKRDLQSDDEIFAEKTQEISSMLEKITDLESAKTELLKKVEDLECNLKSQNHLLISKQMELDRLNERLKVSEGVEQLVESNGLEVPVVARQRAFSVPVQGLAERLTVKQAHARNIHTSPACLTVERVVQNFIARSQLLVAQLEDTDEVLQKTFPGDSPTMGLVSSDSSTPLNTKPKELDDADNQDVDRSWLSRIDIRRGTYRVKRPQLSRPQLFQPDESCTEPLQKSQTDDEKLLVMTSSEQDSDGFSGSKLNSKLAIDQLKANTNLQRKKLKRSELDLRQSTQKLKDLAVNIRLKEQLIRELVKTGQESQHINREYQQKIAALQKEKDEALSELNGLQAALKELENREKNDKAKTERLQSEFQKKTELANLKIHTLQKRQKEMEKMTTLTTNDKRIRELEMAVEKMKQQHDQLQRRLKDEQDRKTKLERDLQKEQQRIKELELMGEQQKKVMKVKMEEMSLMQRKLRTGAHSSYSREEQSRLEEQKKWLDQEMEKVLAQRTAAEELEKELSGREEIIAKKEAMLAEKSELEIKKLRSSQVINKDIIMVSSKLETVEKKISEKTRESHGQVGIELAKLIEERDKLKSHRTTLEAQIQQGNLLSSQEDRRLIELDEAVEALDAAIDFKNEIIDSRKAEVRGSLKTFVNGNEGLMGKLSSLSTNETRGLLARYFGKVINLKDSQRRMKLHINELEVKVDEQESVVRELESSLQQASSESDRKLTKLQQEYERKVQLLVRKLSEKETGETKIKTTAALGDGPVSADNEIRESRQIMKDARIVQMEKELLYYKSVAQELRKKLQAASDVNLSGSINSSIKRGLFRSGLVEKDIVSAEKLSVDAFQRPLPFALGSMTSEYVPIAQLDENASGDRIQTPLTLLPMTVMPVRVSRRDLRRLSNEELILRKASAMEQDASGPT